MVRYSVCLVFTILFFLFTISPACAIRVGLELGVKQSYFATSGTGKIFDLNNNSKVIFKSDKMTSYQLKAHDNSIAIKVGNKFYDLGTGFIKISPDDEREFVSAKKRWYRGELVVYNYDKKLTVINRLPIEKYVLGVVPSEMPSVWNIEALKAQAIAARSYAIANLKKRGSKGYDLVDTPLDQAYGGASAETKKTNEAVLATKGIVLTYKGKVIPAYYHAASGGRTVGSGAVWANDAPYLQSVNAYDGNLQKNGHGVGMSQNGANNLANKGYSAYDILNYFYKGIKFTRINSVE